MFQRTCIECGERYELEEQEIRDGTYSPLCDRCLQESCESNAPASERTVERVIGEMN